MDASTAERWVTISALIVAAIYGYRRVTEQPSTPVTAGKLIGNGPPVPLGAFATAWGFTFLVVAIMAEAAPGLGGAFAILIATGDALTNSASVFADIGKQETPSTQQASTTATATGGTQIIAGNVNPNQVKGADQIVAGTVTQGIGDIGTQLVTGAL